MWLLLACTAPEKPDSDPTVDTEVTQESYEFPWDQEGFWTEAGPLSPMLDVEHRPPAPFWAVWLATSNDGLQWTAQDRPVALGLSSLNLLVTEEGVLLTGVVDLRIFDRLGLELPPRNQLYALVSSDLQNWGSHAWELNDDTSREVIDPGFYFGLDGGLQVAWYGTSYDGDPAQAPGPHSVRGADWDGNQFTLQDVDLYAKENLADPTICLLNGESWMFYTEQAQRIRAARSSDGLNFEEEASFSWDNVTVPSCRPEEDHLIVEGQTAGGSGNPARLQLSGDGSSQSVNGAYTANPFETHDCTSIATGKFGDSWLLVCAASYNE